jgi:ribonuclease HI
VGFDGAGLKEVISITRWYLWWIRRKRTNDESVLTNYKCKMSILAMADNVARVTGRSSPNTDAKWCKPEPRQVKINVDASFYADLHAGSTGAIARDYQGSFIAAKTVYLPHVASPAMEEVIAMREGLSLATGLGCNNIIAESDSIETIHACTGEHSWWNESAAIFADCVDLASLIDLMSFKHCPKEANEVAHELARNSFSYKLSSS